MAGCPGSDNIHDALGDPGCCNWAAGVQKQFVSLGMPFPFSGGHFRNVDHLAFHKAMLARDMSVWVEALHFATWCSLLGCQALHLIVVVCTAGQD